MRGREYQKDIRKIFAALIFLQIWADKLDERKLNRKLREKNPLEKYGNRYNEKVHKKTYFNKNDFQCFKIELVLGARKLVRAKILKFQGARN